MGLPPSDLLHYGPHFMSFVAKSYYRNLRYNRKRAILGYFGPFLPNLGQMRIFSKNRAPSLLFPYVPLISCKTSKNKIGPTQLKKKNKKKQKKKHKKKKKKF